MKYLNEIVVVTRADVLANEKKLKTPNSRKHDYFDNAVDSFP